MRKKQKISKIDWDGKKNFKSIPVSPLDPPPVFLVHFVKRYDYTRQGVVAG